MKVVDQPNDPVFVSQLLEKVELKIGESDPGKSRYALLTPVEVKVLAYALLAEAERVANSPVPPAQ